MLPTERTSGSHSFFHPPCKTTRHNACQRRITVANDNIKLQNTTRAGNTPRLSSAQRTEQSNRPEISGLRPNKAIINFATQERTCGYQGKKHGGIILPYHSTAYGSVSSVTLNVRCGARMYAIKMSGLELKLSADLHTHNITASTKHSKREGNAG